MCRFIAMMTSRRREIQLAFCDIPFGSAMRMMKRMKEKTDDESEA